jgi:hypothetical protein
MSYPSSRNFSAPGRFAQRLPNKFAHFWNFGPPFAVFTNVSAPNKHVTVALFRLLCAQPTFYPLCRKSVKPLLGGIAVQTGLNPTQAFSNGVNTPESFRSIAGEIRKERAIIKD